MLLPIAGEFRVTSVDIVMLATLMIELLAAVLLDMYSASLAVPYLGVVSSSLLWHSAPLKPNILHLHKLQRRLCG